MYETRIPGHDKVKEESLYVACRNMRMSKDGLVFRLNDKDLIAFKDEWRGGIKPTVNATPHERATIEDADFDSF